MNDKKLYFVVGLHRSGTSLVHEVLRSHSEVSGFSGTGAPEDEGQHLQSIVTKASKLGGPGVFGFDARAHMDETHELATAAVGQELFGQWSKYWDLSREYLIEKSPISLVRCRFFQEIFKQSSFLVVLRHPIAVSLATLNANRNWNGKNGSLLAIIDHTLTCYERFAADLPYLDRVRVLRYENLVSEPVRYFTSIYDWMGLPYQAVKQTIRSDVNSRYFEMWATLQDANFIRRQIQNLNGETKQLQQFEERANAFGYSLVTPEAELPGGILGDADCML